VWGVLVAGIAISMLLAGGLKAVQTATIVFALPFALVIVLMVWSLWRTMQQDQRQSERKEKEMRRKVKEWAAKES